MNAAAGDLEAREERGRTVSAVNPMHDEHGAEWEEEMDEKRFTNPAYEGVLVGQFLFEETELQANGGYSRLSSRMGSRRGPKPQLPAFVENSALTPHYSSLDLNNGSTVTDSVGERPAQDPKNHQYEDVDRDSEGEVKISYDLQSRESRGRENTANGLYEDVTIGKQPMQGVNDYTGSRNYEDVGGYRQPQVEEKGELENQELDMGITQRKEWNGIRNCSDDTELTQGPDNRESLDNMLDSEVEGTSV